MLLKDHLIAHWRMNDDAANAIVVDETGNHNGEYQINGVAQNTDTGASTGKINGALDFVVTDKEYVEIADDSDLAFGSSIDFAVSAWIKTSATAREDIIGKDASQAKHWEIFVYQNKLSAYIDDGSNPVTATADGAAINDEAWHHIVVTFDRDGYMKRYVDGLAYGTADDISGVGDIGNSGPQYIGCRIITKEFFNGLIDEVTIFNKILNLNEIKALYNGGAGRETIPIGIENQLSRTGQRFSSHQEM